MDEYLIKTFSYFCKRDLADIDREFESDLNLHLKSIANTYTVYRVISVSHSYVGQFVSFVVTIKKIDL